MTTEEYQPQQPAQQQDNSAAMQLLILALKTLSQRTIVALAGLKYLMLSGSVFWTTLVVVENPSTAKLVGLGIFAAFVLLGEMLTHRK